MLLKCLMLGFFLSFPSSLFAADVLPVIDPDQVIAKYGTPDIIDSTAYDKPRPPIVVKEFIYKKEDVMIVFVAADAPMGAPPPYSVWRLFGIEDAKGKRVLSVAEFKARMAKRIKQP